MLMIFLIRFHLLYYWRNLTLQYQKKYRLIVSEKAKLSPLTNEVGIKPHMLVQAQKHVKHLKQRCRKLILDFYEP